MKQKGSKPVRLLLALALMFAAAAPAMATVRCVPDTSVDSSCAIGYTTVQAAVAAAVAGDTVIVGSGTYSTSSQLIDILVPLTLQGEDTGSGKPVLDGGGSTYCCGPIIGLDSSNVTISGFEIRYAEEAAGAIMNTSSGPSTGRSNITITNNYIHDNGGDAAIYTNGAGLLRNWLVVGNIIQNNSYSFAINDPDQHLAVHLNCFSGNNVVDTPTLSMYLYKGSMDARYNYWGAPTGPNTDDADIILPGYGAITYRPFNASCIK